MKEELKVLFRTIEKLKQKYKHHNKSFTLDGKLVGDIGEVLVAEHYGLTLYNNNEPIYDGYVTDDESKKVQIKASFNEYFYFTKDTNNKPDYFIAVLLKQDGTFEEIYNGRGEFLYDTLLKHLPVDRKHPYRLSVKKLKELNKSNENTDKIKTK
jgi:hypothetical protein